MAAFQSEKEKSQGAKSGDYGGWKTTVMLFLFLVERKCATVRCRDATASSFVAKFRGEVFARFHAVTLNRHSSMRN
jgi:hypothetical protein